ncbi:hypothetical protein DS884_05375 [Tenacibaculum sp. E3R01]|uniref:hypothetical protein n=1 Tax=Tenacibaculum sp. E3R01 TaxID=2267227 RepID=UPI000DEA8037|nr:hypothetical protein [Tenacibaculum sp. E3R01]RBW59179.1 hypothetical protein DS884_05375 [Tenacibaculum sp. E3R01]
MKKFFSLLIAIIITSSVFGQTPDLISYQAVIRDATNALIKEQSIGVQISILKGSINGSAVYSETQTPSTNKNGLISLEIGKGINVTGKFNSIDWSSDTFFIKTEIDPVGGTNYKITGTSQLMSVPYALHAKTASNFSGTIKESQISDLKHTIDTNTQLSEAEVDSFVDNNGYLKTEVDGSITNEIQDLSLVGNKLKITKNGTATTIDLSGYLDNTDTQLTETQVDAFVDNNGYLKTEVDGSVTNEIQDLSLVGNKLKITKNGTATTIDLSRYLDNTDTQLTESQVDAFVDNNGYLKTEVDGSVTNEIQDLSLIGNKLKITKNGTATTIDLSKYLDNTNTQLTESQVDVFANNNGYLKTEVDGSVTNEIQDLSLVGNKLKITNNESAVTIDLSKFLDNTNTQLTESQVDAFANNNGYLQTEVDGSITNEIQDLSLVDNNLKITNNSLATTVDLSKYSELPTQSGNSGKVLTTDGTSSSWSAPATPSLAEVLTKSSDAGTKTITNLSKLGVGTSTVTSGAAVEINSTTGGLLLPRLTTAERDALAKNPGLIIFNKETGKFQGYQGFPESELFINHNTFIGNLTFSGQSFTATETGNFTKLVLNFQAAVTGGTLKIYSGNTVTGTPIHTQSYTVGAGEQEIVLSNAINVVSGQQYTVFVNTTCAYYPFATYAGGTAFTVNLAFPGDLWMKVKFGKSSWVDLH